MALLDFREWLAEDEQLSEAWGRTKLAALVAALAMTLTGCGGKPRDAAERDRIVKLAKDTSKIGPNGYMAAKELLEKHGINALEVLGPPPPPKVSEDPRVPPREARPVPDPVRPPPGVTVDRPPSDPTPLPLPAAKPPQRKDGPNMTRIPGDKMNLGHVVQLKVSGPARAYRHEYTILDAANSTAIEEACEALRINYRKRHKEQDIGDAFGMGGTTGEAIKKALERAQVQEENRVEACHTAYTTRILGGRIVAVIVYVRTAK